METEKPKKYNIIPAIIFFGLFCPFWLLAFLIQAIQKGREITPTIILISIWCPLFCWCYLAWLIVQHRKPVKILTEEEKKLKKDKENRLISIIAPFFVIALMISEKNYSSWILWTLLALFLLGWIQFLPDAIKKPFNEFANEIFKVIGGIVLVVLIIVGIIAFFSGLATISTTNFILLLILWAVLSRE